MNPTSLPPGFGLVPLRESAGLHRNHPAHRRIPRAQLRSMRDRDGRVYLDGKLFQFDPMAYQASRILRDVLAELWDA